MNVPSFIQEFYSPLAAFFMIGIKLENGEMGLRPLMVCYTLIIRKSWITTLPCSEAFGGKCM